MNHKRSRGLPTAFRSCLGAHTSACSPTPCVCACMHLGLSSAGGCRRVGWVSVPHTDFRSGPSLSFTSFIRHEVLGFQSCLRFWMQLVMPQTVQKNQLWTTEEVLQRLTLLTTTGEMLLRQAGAVLDREGLMHGLSQDHTSGQVKSQQETSMKQDTAL